MRDLTLSPAYAWGLVVLAALSVVALGISLHMALAGLLFVLVAWWAWQEPEPGFLFLVVLAPLLPLLKATQTLDDITLVKDVIILTLAARLFIYPLLTKQLPYRRLELIFPLLLLGAWVLLGVARADSPVLGIVRARDLLLYPLLYVVAAYLPTSSKIWRERLWWFLGSATAVLLLGAYQWLWAADSAVLRLDPERSIWIPRLSATFVHPSIYGEYLVLVVTLLLALFLQIKDVRARFMAAVLGLGNLLSIYLTYSRGVWLGLVAAVIAMFVARLRSASWRSYGGQPYWKRQRLISGSVAIIVTVIFFLLMTSAGTFLRSSFDPTYGSNEIRLEFLARLLSSVSNSEALFGKGLGDVVTQNFRVIDLQGSEVVLGEARAVQRAKDATLVDNQYLKTFVELGLFGLLIYFWLFWRLARSAWQAAQAQETVRRILGLWTFGFLAAFIIQAFFIDIWDIFPTNAAFWILAGLLAAREFDLIPERVAGGEN